MPQTLPSGHYTRKTFFLRWILCVSIFPLLSYFCWKLLIWNSVLLTKMHSDFEETYDIFCYTWCSFLTKYLLLILAICRRLNAQAIQCQGQISTQKAENDEVLLIVLKLKESKHFIQSVEQWLKLIQLLVVDVPEVQNIEVRQIHTKKTIHSEDEMIWTVLFRSEQRFQRFLMMERCLYAEGSRLENR